MPHIVWKGITREDDEIFDLSEPLPEGSVKLALPDNPICKAIVFAIPAVVICFLALFGKAAAAHTFPLASSLFILLGIVLGVLFCIIHELLHALPQPSDATVYLGFVPKGFLFYMKCTAPLTKRRFILMSLLPMLLGLLPLLIFLISPADWTVLNSILWPMAMIGLFSPCPDYQNVFHVMYEVPDNALIQDGPDGIYWFETKSHYERGDSNSHNSST